jgi:ribonuclease VapC
MIYVDASAVVAALLAEPMAERVIDRLRRERHPITSPIAVYEAALAIARVRAVEPERARGLVDRFLGRFDVAIVPIDGAQADLALSAHARFGKGRHAARLNLGDCFAYAAAKSRNAAILFVGDDFTLTDLPDALAGA